MKNFTYVPCSAPWNDTGIKARDTMSFQKHFLGFYFQKTSNIQKATTKNVFQKNKSAPNTICGTAIVRIAIDVFKPSYLKSGGYDGTK